MYEDLTFTLLFGAGAGFCGVFAAVAFLLGRYLKLRRNRVPQCGHCGYAVAGLSSSTCPECGNNLQLVGIITPSLRRPVPRRWGYLLWTLFLPMTIYTIVILLINNVLHGIVIIDQSITLSKPDSGLYDHIDLYLHMNGSTLPDSEEVAWTIPPDQNGELYNIIIKIYLKNSDREPSATLRFNTLSGKSIYITANGESSTFNEDNLHNMQSIMEQCFKTIGLDLRNKDLQNELSFFQGPVTGNKLSYGLYKPQRIAGIISKPVPYWTASWNKYVNYHGPPKWFIPICVVVWFMIWIIGLRYLFVLTKKPPVVFSLENANHE